MNANDTRERSYYAPYDKYPAFDRGMRDYNNHVLRNPYEANSVDAQAWDRGAEYAMHVAKRKLNDRHTD